MATLSSFLEAARYDLIDYEEGVQFENRELINYLNRMIKLIDSTLLISRSDLLHGTEMDIDTVASQDYVDLTNLNNGYWDSIREVWIGSDKKEPISVPMMYYKRKFRNTDVEPQYFAVEGNHLLFETGVDSAHTNLIIHYNKKTRPRLESWSDTFGTSGVATTTDIITLASGAHTFYTGSGRFQFTTTATLPTGISASTDYWIIYDPTDTDGIRIATSKSNALGERILNNGDAIVEGQYYQIVSRTTTDFTDLGAANNNAGTRFTATDDGSLGASDIVRRVKAVDISATGSGTHTITHTEYTPYGGRYDEFLREMLVMHARGKREGGTSQADAMFQSVFRKRLFEEEMRRGFQEPSYYVDF